MIQRTTHLDETAAWKRVEIRTKVLRLGKDEVREGIICTESSELPMKHGPWGRINAMPA